MTSTLQSASSSVSAGRSSPDRLSLLMYGDFSLDGIWYSRHHFAVRLARHNRVILIDQPRELRHTLLSPLHFLRPGRLSQDSHGPERYTSPGWMPDVYRWPGVRKTLNRWRADALLKKTASTTAPIRYVWNPACQEAAEPRDDLPLVYHAYDKYDQYTDAAIDEVVPRERWLAQRADFCVAASTPLGDYLKSLGARAVHVLRHGVDTDLFRPGHQVPEALARVPRPRIGVVARLNEVLDVETLMRVAKERPRWSIVLIGGDYFTDPAKHERFLELCRLPNVHPMGPQPREAIPQWLAGFDVGLACYDMATWVPYSQPIKMYEYLACGLPVVATDLVATREVGAVIQRCSSADEWVPAIEQALEPVTSEVLEQRVKFARANSWDSRVSELEGLLKELV